MCGNKIIVIAGVSGVGKTFLINALLNELPSVKKLTTVTTRPKRNNELAAESKRFIDEYTFNKMLGLKKLQIANTVFGYKYAFDPNESKRILKKSHLILELRAEYLPQAREVFGAIFSIYLYPYTADMAIKNITDEDTYNIRLCDNYTELEKFKNGSLSNLEMIDLTFCNHYNKSSVEDFITVIKKVLAYNK